MNVIEKVDGLNISFDEPNICPQCKHAIKPQMLKGTVFLDSKNDNYCAVLYLCNHCYRPFIGYFKLTKPQTAGRPLISSRIYVEPNRFTPQEFDPHITSVSPAFVEIYNQALAAEDASLDQIAGMGYRKALEFLIKDYLIHKSPEDEQAIKDAPLSACINKRVSDPRIRAVAKRSAWLGNDQTHYIKKFEDYDLEALKRFINTTVYWISMELNTDEALEIESRR